MTTPASPSTTDAAGPLSWGGSAGPWALAYRRLRGDRVVAAFAALLALIAAACLAAPLWSEHVAQAGPNEFHLGADDTIAIDGEERPIVLQRPGELSSVPIGPGPHWRFLLGADENGRDVLVRLLYGGRTSLAVAIGAALIATALAVVLGLVAGYRRGWADAVISRGLDVLWAFPVLLLGVALGAALALDGLRLGPLTVDESSLWIPVAIIALAYVPYVARPLRAQVLGMREREFVEAAVAQGQRPLRLMATELLPNLWPTVVVLFTIVLAHAMLLEAALSFLGVGIRPPATSWGTMAADGFDRLTTAPHLTLVPGAMIALTVLSVYAVGDRLRRALDPRAIEGRAGMREG